MKIAILSRSSNLYSTSRLREAAVERGHEVSVVSSVDSALLAVEGRDHDLAIIDYHLDGLDTSSLAATFSKRGIPLIVCSAAIGLAELGEVFQGTTFLGKLFSTVGLLDAVSAAARCT